MTGASFLVGVLVATAVVGLRPSVRRVGRTRVGHAGRTSVPRRSGARHPRWGRARGSAAREEVPDVAAVLLEVAARLRAGQPSQEAWARASAGRGIDGAGGWSVALLPTAGAAGSTSPRRPAASRRSVRGPRGAEVAAVRAATLLADHAGAPLADVLDRCAVGVAEAGRAEAARRVALAGPASTARLLGWLPLAGLMLGWVVGADPLAALVDGGIGSAAGLTGIGLMALGRRWTAALVASARGRSGAA